jgi:hypothetical protein
MRILARSGQDLLDYENILSDRGYRHVRRAIQPGRNDCDALRRAA